MRCPFGCRECHKKKSSDARSQAYNSSPDGKKKKETLNARRSQNDGGDPPRSMPEANALIRYLQFLVAAIEKRHARVEEILHFLRWCEERLRQHPLKILPDQ